jgi:arylsulfatase A-like enzyme
MTDIGCRPNIVFILTDDHAAHAIGCYGSVVNRTPRIDELAHNGCRLDNCFVTNSLCTPSRASILTGAYSHANGVYSLFTPIDASQTTFISRLRESGYRTAMIGKWHLGHGPGHDPEGFDYWDVVPGQGDYWNPTFINPDGRRTVEGYATDIITDLAMDWVESLDDRGRSGDERAGAHERRPGGDEPWCMLVWHKAPHRPWEPKPEHQALYEDPRPLPSTFWDDYSTRSVAVRRTAMRVADHLGLEDLKTPPPRGLSYEEEAVWKYQRYMRDYLACVHSVDENVGRLIDWLRARGDFDDTMVIYSSDQGFFLGDHGWFDKRLMYEESLRMPFVLSYPRRVAAGFTFDRIVTNVDMAQTILDAAGTGHGAKMQGRSFWPELSGEEADDRNPVEGFYYRYWENDDVIHKAPAHYGYRTDRYKLIYYYNDGLGLPFTGFFRYPAEWELYDLEADPRELHNVYDHPDYARIGDELKAAMWREQARLGDAPHPSQPVPAGCEDVPVAELGELPLYRWLDPGPME